MKPVSPILLVAFAFALVGFLPQCDDDSDNPTPSGSSGTGGDGTDGDSGIAGNGGTMTYDVPGQSCQGGLDCGGTSCCDSVLVPGGTFPMGRGTEDCGEKGCLGAGENAGCPMLQANGYWIPCGSNERPEHSATVADFRLDRFEVTVGRFRKFVQAFDGTAPAVGTGAHPLIPGSGWPLGAGLLPRSKSELIQALKCYTGQERFGTWTDEPSAHENSPINCIGWHVAFAFCIWDGGRLPTEAEWEYAAAGGDENRLYPWGSEDPSVNIHLANDGWSNNGLTVGERGPLFPVNTYPAGRGRWGHSDLAGSVREWVRDGLEQYGDEAVPCENCANLSGGFSVVRGGSWISPAGSENPLRAAHREHSPLTDTMTGVRCARNVDAAAGAGGAPTDAGTDASIDADSQAGTGGDAGAGGSGAGGKAGAGGSAGTASEAGADDAGCSAPWFDLSFAPDAGQCALGIPIFEVGVLDPNSLSLQYISGGGTGTPIPRVNGSSECGSGDGWHYDDKSNPSVIILCPATCATVAATPDSGVQASIACLSP